MVTGPTSGLGLAAAKRFAGAGATLVLVGRDPGRTMSVRDVLVEQSGNDRLSVVVADMSDRASVAAAAAEIDQSHDRVDVLVHNAGALLAERQVNPDGVEMSVAAQVLGPFLLTGLLLEALGRASPGRVVTVSSGGMYTAPLTVEHLEMTDDYRGAEQYARAKRAQVTLNEMWAKRCDAGSVVFHAMHPGWADTPGVAASLPTFRRIVGPALRSADQGADTIVWLAADPEPSTRTGCFWLDRRERPIHRTSATRRSDTPAERRRLWEWCERHTGLDVPDC